MAYKPVLFLPNVTIAVVDALPIPIVKQDVEIDWLSGLNENPADAERFTTFKPFITKFHHAYGANFFVVVLKPVIDTSLK